jgi:hypothetical protein
LLERINLSASPNENRCCCQSRVFAIGVRISGLGNLLINIGGFILAAKNLQTTRSKYRAESATADSSILQRLMKSEWAAA